jgi:uncharacterized protein involved in cysteine biosynthesis
MSAVLKSLSLAIGQLSDQAVMRVLLKTVAITIGIFIVAAGLLWWALDAFIEGWIIATLPQDYSNSIAGLIAVIAALIGGWLLFRVVALAVLQFFADEIVTAVEQCHYPECAATARQLPFREDLANSVRGAGRALLWNALALPVALVLFFTAIGPAVVFLAVNAVLLGRELTDMGWFRHRPTPEAQSPVGKFDRLLLGGAIAGLMAVPLLNLLAPIIGAAAGTHLVQIARNKSP